MFRAILLVLCIAALPAAASAARPDMQPGRWEYTFTTHFEGPVNIPDQTRTQTQCITESDLEDADTYVPQAGECNVQKRDIDGGSVSITLVCPGQQGNEVRMDTEMRLSGDRLEGQSTTTMQMGGQQMQVRTRIEAHRTGDC